MSKFSTTVHMADDIESLPSGKTTIITIGVPIQKSQSTESLVSMFNKDAKKLSEALIGSLPGGTLDRLLIRLLHNKQSSLRTGLWPKKPFRSII